MGGKSRKSGGVSKKLIAALKSGKYGNNTSTGGKKSENENSNRVKSIFTTGTKDRD